MMQCRECLNWVEYCRRVDGVYLCGHCYESEYGFGVRYYTCGNCGRPMNYTDDMQHGWYCVPCDDWYYPFEEPAGP